MTELPMFVPIEVGPTEALAQARVDPSQLSAQTAAAVSRLLRDGESSNTRTSYQSALRYWAAWYALRFGKPIALPVPVPTVLQFIVDHLQSADTQGLRHELPTDIDQALVQAGYKTRPGPLALNTVSHRVSVLSKVHTVHGLENPCRAEAVKGLLSRGRRAYASRGATTAHKDALTKAPLEALLATCDDSLTGLRDRALLLFAWSSGGRRRSEVVRATIENTRKVADRTWLYSLAHSKTNQTGIDRPGNDKPIVGVAAEALEAWLDASKIQSGAIFRRIRKGSTVGEPLAGAAVRQIVQHRATLAGLSGNFSAHSLRSGFVTEAGRQNVPLGDTMAMTGHSSVATVMRYFRSGDLLQGRAARLVDTD